MVFKRKLLKCGCIHYCVSELFPTCPDVLGVDTRPANALTLDEIQARENIHTPLSHPGDQSAFNKLVAQLQFTGGIHHEEKSPAVSVIISFILLPELAHMGGGKIWPGPTPFSLSPSTTACGI